jgi:hypothetical protein
MPMECSHADPGEHRRAVTFCSQQQRLHRGLPFFGIVFCLGQFSDVMCGVTVTRCMLGIRSPFPLRNGWDQDQETSDTANIQKPQFYSAV